MWMLSFNWLTRQEILLVMIYGSVLCSLLPTMMTYRWSKSLSQIYFCIYNRIFSSLMVYGLRLLCLWPALCSCKGERVSWKACCTWDHGQGLYNLYFLFSRWAVWAWKVWCMIHWNGLSTLYYFLCQNCSKILASMVWFICPWAVGKAYLVALEIFAR